MSKAIAEMTSEELTQEWLACERFIGDPGKDDHRVPEACNRQVEIEREQACRRHTPGPWRVGDGSFVISDNQAPGIAGSDDIRHYGGHLICESVSRANARLIATAPEMRELLSTIENDSGQVPGWLWNRIQDVLKRSE